MRINYFAYFIEDTDTGEKYLMNMLPFLTRFCFRKDSNFKRRFLFSNGERLYLFKIDGNLFLFIMTKNSDIIKAVNTLDVNYDEIYSRLWENEQLGFASYVYFDDAYYGLASTMSGPKNSAFTYLVNDIFTKLNINKRYEFKSQPIMVQVTKRQVMKLGFIGRTVVEVDTRSNLGAQLLGLFGGDDAGFDSIEVVLKPRRRKSIDRTIKKFLKNYDDRPDEFRKFLLKAKDNLEDNLTDFYLVGAGILSDQIHSREEGKIRQEIVKRVTENRELNSKVYNFFSGGEFKRQNVQAISHYNIDSAWGDSL